MEQAGIHPTLVANPHKAGELIAVLLPEQVTPLLQSQGHATEADNLHKRKKESAEATAREAREEAKTAYESAWRWALLEATWDQICEDTPVAPSDAMLRHLAAQHARALNTDQAKRLCKLLDLGKVAPRDGVEQWVQATDAPGDALMLLTAFRDVEYRVYLSDPAAGNAGLMILAQDYGVNIEKIKQATRDRLAAAAQTALALPKPEALNPDLPQRPAAQAGGGAGGDKSHKKGKKTDRPAAARKDKVSAAEAGKSIAAAMQALEPITGADAQGNVEGSGFALPSPPAQDLRGTPADACTPAAETTAGAPASAPPTPTAPTQTAWIRPEGTEPAPSASEGIALGARVRVLPTARGPKQAPHVGKLGYVRGQIGPSAWDVCMPASRKKAGGVGIYVGFDTSELEVVQS